MERLKAEEITENLTEKQLKILALMMDQNLVSNDWLECFKVLSDQQKFDIHEMLGRIIDKNEKERLESRTKEEMDEESAKWEHTKNDPDPNKFYGNMGQPDTPQEYKNRYGVWPLGYNQETGKKLTDVD